MGALPQESRVDRIAQLAATLIVSGQVVHMNQAIRAAAESLGLAGGPMPGHGTVRKHAQAIAMQSKGQAGYELDRLNTWSVAEELMTALDQEQFDPLLMGRAAAGQMDAGVTLHIRLYTDQPISGIAQALVGYGYDEPTFSTVRSMHGPMNRICLIEQSIPIALTVCRSSLRVSREVDVFTGRPIAALSLTALRREVEALRRSIRR